MSNNRSANGNRLPSRTTFFSRVWASFNSIFASAEAPKQPIAPIGKNTREFISFDYYGMSDLTIAARRNDIKEIYALYAECYNINQKDLTDNTPLLSAIRSGRVEAARALLELGALVDIKNNQKNTALTLAASMNNLAMVELLIQYGANVNSANVSGNTALQFAVVNNNYQMTKFLIDHGADKEQKNIVGNCASMLVKPTYDKELVALFKAEAEKKLAKTDKIMQTIASGCQLDDITKLIEFKYDELYAMTGKQDITKKILEIQMLERHFLKRMDGMNTPQSSALRLNVSAHQSNMIRYINTIKNTLINIQTATQLKYKRSFWDILTRTNRAPHAIQVIQRKINELLDSIEKMDSDNVRKILATHDNVTTQINQILILQNLPGTAKDPVLKVFALEIQQKLQMINSTMRAYHVAPVIETSLNHEQEAALQQKDRELAERITRERLETDLLNAVKNNNLDEVKRLVKANVNINVLENKTASNCLTIATIRGNAEMVAYLIESGINVNHVNKFGRTALHYIMVNPNPEIANQLRFHAANINAKDKHGLTPRDLATLDHHVLPSMMLKEEAEFQAIWPAASSTSRDHQTRIANQLSILENLAENGAALSDRIPTRMHSSAPAIKVWLDKQHQIAQTKKIYLDLNSAYNQLRNGNLDGVDNRRVRERIKKLKDDLSKARHPILEHIYQHDTALVHAFFENHKWEMNQNAAVNADNDIPHMFSLDEIPSAPPSPAPFESSFASFKSVEDCAALTDAPPSYQAHVYASAQCAGQASQQGIFAPKPVKAHPQLFAFARDAINERVAPETTVRVPVSIMDLPIPELEAQQVQALIESLHVASHEPAPSFFSQQKKPRANQAVSTIPSRVNRLLG